MRALRAIALVTTVLAPLALAQTITTAEITGAVLDSSGKLVVSATVRLKSLDTGEARTASSNAFGIYRFAFVAPGAYEISGSSAGLKSDLGQLVAAVGQVQTIDLRLTPEEPRTVILVTDAAPLLDTDNANIVYTVSTRQLELLPLGGGDLVSVAYSVPGVVINSRAGAGSFALSGQGGVSNLFTVNGIDDMDPHYNVNNSGATSMLIGVNEVREASVIQNPFEGQYGRQTGAQVNYVTKTGGNRFHGNLVHSYNGSLLNANDFFNNATATPIPHAVSNQYAASLGGPVVRDRLFFFADTEGIRFAEPSSFSAVAAPSTALEEFSLRSIQPSQAPLYQKMFDLYNNAPGQGRAVPVTNGTGLLEDSTGRLGCGRLAGTPAGNGGIFGVDVSCATAWQSTAAVQLSEWLLAVRVDYHLAAKQAMFFRFKTDQGSVPGAVSNISPIFNPVSDQPDYEGQLSHTLTVTPRLVNSFIAAGTYNSYVFDFANLNAALQAFPLRINILDKVINGGSMASVGAPASYPFGRRASQVQIIDDISYISGRHSFKAGVNYRANTEADLANAGFVYVPRVNLYSLAEFASGAFNGATRSTYMQTFNPNPVIHFQLNNLGVYLQDQWAGTAHFKVNVTVRFDRTGNPYCQEHCFARLLTPFPESQVGVGVSYNQSIQSGLAEPFYRVESIVPQPRVSFVYSPPWATRTVVRAGIGLFADLYPAFFVGNMAGNAPRVYTAQFNAGLINSGGVGSAPAIATASAAAFANGFASGATLAQLQQAVAPVPFAPPTYYSIPSILRIPKALEWSMEVERQLWSQSVLSLRYIGSHGYDVFLNNANINATARPGFVGLPATASDPRFGQISQLTNNGFSNYQGLAMILRRSFSRGFQGQIGYTWSHALDTLSNGGLLAFASDSLVGQIDPVHVRPLNYGSADYDVRHNLTADFVWEVPFKTTPWLDAFFGGWSLGGRLNAHTGTPFTVVDSGVGGISNTGTMLRADLVDPGIRTNCGRSAVDTPCFTAAEFLPPALQADLGNVPRNSFRAPAYFNLDWTLFKNVSIWDRVRLAIGASIFNLLNHPNFFDPNHDLAGSGFGLITSTVSNPSSPYGYGGYSGRTVVVTGKLKF
jgi:hypothetical protein